MKITLAVLSSALLMGACASKNKLDSAALEKYPQCYHKNVKISNKCIEKNNAGENVTAVQIENTAYPGQYK
jgi:hypothetical protein